MTEQMDPPTPSECQCETFRQNYRRRTAQTRQAANLRGFRASVSFRLEGGILHFIDGISDFRENFNTV